MATLTVTTVSRAGVRADDAVAVTPTTGDEFANVGQEFVFIKNGAGVETIATIDITATVDGQTVTDRAVSIPAGQEMLIGPFSTSIYNNANGRVKVTCAPTATVTIKAFKFTNG